MQLFEIKGICKNGLVFLVASVKATTLSSEDSWNLIGVGTMGAGEHWLNNPIENFKVV